MANNEVLRKIGSPDTIILADTADFDNDPDDDNVQIDLTSLGNTTARQSDKFDFGEEWAELYDVVCSFEIDVAPASGETVDVYIAPSAAAVAADENPGGVVGSDSAYTGSAGDSITDSLKQLEQVGPVTCTADADPVMQTQHFVYAPHARYATLVVFNQSGQAFVADATHHYIMLTPIVPEIQ